MNFLRRPYFVALVISALLAWALPAFAGWGTKLTLPAPAPVVDEFGLLSASEQERLADLVKRIKTRSGVEVAVFIPASLQGEEINEFGIAVAEQWKLEKKKDDKGLILLIAPKERKMRIEVGYGLEGEITDAFSRRVLDGVIAPLFRRGNYYEGLVRGLLALQEKVPLGLEENGKPGDLGLVERPVSLWAIFLSLPFLFQLFLIYLVCYLPVMFVVRTLQALGLMKRPQYRNSRHWGGWSAGSPWDSGWGGGGGWGGGRDNDRWGGGGGGFGGGGASSSW